MGRPESDQATLASDEPTVDAVDHDSGPGRPDPAPPAGRDLPEVDRERYEVKAHVASGGGGSIHAARDGWLGRTVALKRQHRSDDPRASERFVREALLTARLQHPGIVPVYEAGRWPDGDPFYVMKLVSGEPLSRELSRAKTLAERLALLPHVLDVAEAMAYAHSQEIIHRDLKPSNVLVGKFGETVVIDWGLGKDLSEDGASPSRQPGVLSSLVGSLDSKDLDEAVGSEESARADDDLTRKGAVMGTPAYMPPEQARGEPVGPAADVYALGAILYHLLSGRAPYERGTGIEVLARVLSGPPEPLSTLVPRAPRELVAIVDKAMARDLRWRYSTADQLAEDLRRFQTGQIVGAHRYTAWQRLRRWAWRYRTGLVATLAALSVLVVGGVYSFVQLQDEVRRTQGEQRRAEESAAVATAAKQDAEAANRRATDRADALRIQNARVLARRAPNRAIAALHELSDRYTEWSRVQVIASDASVHGLAMVVPPCTAAPPPCLPAAAVSLSADGHRLEVQDRDRRMHAYDARDGQDLGPVVPIEGVLLSTRRGPRLVTLDEDGQLLEWNTIARTHRRLEEPPERLVKVWAVGEDMVLALQDRGSEQVVWRWGTEGPPRVVGECLRRAERSFAVVSISSDERWLACVSEVGALAIHDLRDGGSTTVPVDGFPLAVAVGTDARWLSWGGPTHSLEVWSREDGHRVAVEQEEDEPFTTIFLHFVPDSPRVLAVSYDGQVASWEPGQPRLTELSRHQGKVGASHLSTDGRLFATGGGDGSVHVHDLESGLVRVLLGFEGASLAVRLLPDGDRVAAYGVDGTLRAWTIDREHGAPAARLPTESSMMTIDPARGDLVVSGTDGTLWSISPQQRPSSARRLHQFEGRVRKLVVSPGGTWAAVGTAEGTVGLCALDGGGCWQRALDRGDIHGLSFSADERTLAVATYAEGPAWVDVSSRSFEGTDGHRIAGVEMTSEGRLLAWSHEGWIGAWSADRTPLWRKEYAEELWVAAVSPGGDAVVFAGRDGRLRRLSLPGGEEVVAEAKDLGVMLLRYFDDGAELVTAGNDQHIRRWDAETLEQRGLYVGHRSFIGDVAVHRERGRIVSASHDGTARVWDLVTGESRELFAHDGPVGAVRLSADGRTIYTGGADGTVRRWPDALPLREQPLRKWLADRAQVHEKR